MVGWLLAVVVFVMVGWPLGVHAQSYRDPLQRWSDPNAEALERWKLEREVEEQRREIERQKRELEALRQGREPDFVDTLGRR